MPVAKPHRRLPPEQALPSRARRGAGRDFGFAEVVKYCTDWSPSIGATFTVTMSWDTWHALPADVQDVIDDLAREQGYAPFPGLVRWQICDTTTWRRLDIERFHAAEDSQTVRNAVFGTIAEQFNSLVINTVVVEKSKTGPALAAS